METNFFMTKFEEENIIVDNDSKVTKSSGIKKLRLGTAESVVGLNEKEIP